MWSWRLGLCVFVVAAPAAAFADSTLPYKGDFALTYTFATSNPATPIKVGNNRDLTVNNYLATMINERGSGFLHQVAGHCTNIRFTDRVAKTIDSRGYCDFADKNGDHVFLEYVTGLKPSDAIVVSGKFTSGTGAFEGITGNFEGPNSNNLDTGGAYQAAGRFLGSYKIEHSTDQASYGLHD